MKTDARGDVAKLEAAGYDTWTPDQSANIAGWDTYATAGYTRRVNCVTGSGDLPVDPEVRMALERWLAERGADLVVRVTPLLSNVTVESITSDWSYQPVDDTVVMNAPVVNAEADDEVRLVPCNDSGFLADLARLNNGSTESAAVRKRMMDRVADRATGVWIPGIAVGFAAQSGSRCAVYSVAVAPDHRRQGIGNRLMASINAWATERGCGTLFLQVLGNNSPALRLYEQLGFVERYRYHYLEPEVGDA